MPCHAITIAVSIDSAFIGSALALWSGMFEMGHAMPCHCHRCQYRFWFPSRKVMVNILTPMEFCLLGTVELDVIAASIDSGPPAAK